MKLFTAILLALAPFAPAAERPNILLILADDMGFSDLGCYGSEIATPNLDALAAGGVRFSQFYNSARCCPTRALLLTNRALNPRPSNVLKGNARQACRPIRQWSEWARTTRVYPK